MFFREWRGCDPVLLSVQKEVFRGSAEQLSYVVHVVAACFRDLEGLQQPVLLQVLRVGVVVELL